MSAYLNYARGYYRKDGKETGEVDAIKAAIKAARQLYGHFPAIEFGPVCLSAVRQTMIDNGMARTTCNAQCGRLRRVYRWAVARELVEPQCLVALSALEPLRRGRCRARETSPVKPVPDQNIDAVMPFLPQVVADILRLQRASGARPAEVCGMRADEIERTANGPWVYRPSRHKTEHLEGRDAKVVFLGAKAKAIVSKYLADADACDGYLFAPASSERRREAERRRQRKSKVWESHSNESREGRRRKRGIKARKFEPFYSVSSYRHALQRACDRAGVENFSPHMVRHTVGTEVRRLYGLEAAQSVLSHRSLAATQVYAERSHELARRVAQDVG
jgi:integrase